MKLTLKAARINKGYNQKKAAELLQVSKFTLSNYERGRSYPNAGTIKKMETIYGVPYAIMI